MSEQNLTQAVMNSSDGDDQVSKTRTIYDVTVSEIFWKNLLAGFSRGLGMFLVYLILILIVGTLFTSIVLPQLKPFIDAYMGSMKALNSLQQYQQNLPF